MFIGKKKGVFVLLIILFLLTIFSVPFILAQDEDPKVAEAYSCLERLVKEVTPIPTLIPEQLAFSLLALSYNEELQPELHSALLSKAINNECWGPSSGCKIKDTALAILALNSIGEDTTKAQEWLLSKKKVPENVEWYLEIDSSQAATCTITYDSDYRISIGDDRKITGSAGPCLSLSHGGYWFKINADNVDCQKKEYRISCDKNFYSTILYKKVNDLVWHVSNQLQSASPNTERTTHTLSYFCFTSSQTCDYEGTLWAAVALKLSRNTVSLSQFMPYILLFAKDGDNPKLFPETFLYKLTNAEYYNAAILAKKRATYDYWDLRSKDGKFFDTALVLFSIGDTTGATKNYLLSENVFQSTNCWGGVRTTSFLLFAGWPKTPITPPPKCVEELNANCLTQQACADTKGSIIEGTCPVGTKCCNQKPLNERTCPEAGWEVCDVNERCNGLEIPDKDRNKCCVFGTEIQEQTICIDSDAGQNFGLKGTTTLTAEGSTPREDYCVSATSLVEFYCDSGVKQLQHTCIGGCSNGACTGEIIEEEQQGCVQIPCEDITIPGKTLALCDVSYQTCKGDIFDSSDETGICCSGTCKNAKCSDLGKRGCENYEACLKEELIEGETQKVPADIIQTSDVENCCSGTCEIKNCAELPGLYETCPPNKDCDTTTINAPDNPNCCPKNHCTILKSCSLFGELGCDINEVCVKEDDTQELSIFYTSLEFPNDNKCCAGKCVPKTCNEIVGSSGEICVRGEKCLGQEYDANNIDTGAGQKCCLGKCELQTCYDAGGRPCQPDERCDPSSFETSDSTKCCLNSNDCKPHPFNCASEGLFCITEENCENVHGEPFYTATDCLPLSGGRSTGNVCCSKSPSQDCDELGGKLCEINQECSEDTVLVDGNEQCCFADCQVARTCEEIGGVLEGSQGCSSDKECQGTTYETIDGDCCVGGCVWKDCSIIGLPVPCSPLEICSVPEAVDSSGDSCCVRSLGSCITRNCNQITNGQFCDASKKCDTETLVTPDTVINNPCCLAPNTQDHCTLTRKCEEFGTTCLRNERCSTDIQQASDIESCCVKKQDGTSGCELLNCAQFGGNKCGRGQTCRGQEYASRDAPAGGSEKCCIGTCEYKPCLQSNGKDCPVNQRCNGLAFRASDTQACCPNELNPQCIDYPFDCNAAQALFCITEPLCNSLLGEGFWGSSNCFNPNICCTKSTSQTCEALGGKAPGTEDCPINKKCSIPTVSVADTTQCCFGNCDSFKTCEEINGVLEGSDAWPSWKKCGGTEYTTLETTGQANCCVGGLAPRDCEYIGDNGGEPCGELEKCSLASAIIATPDNPQCCVEVLGGQCIQKNCDEIPTAQTCPANYECDFAPMNPAPLDNPKCCNRPSGDNTNHCTILKNCAEFGEPECPLNKQCSSGIYLPAANGIDMCCVKDSQSVGCKLKQCDQFGGNKCQRGESCNGFIFESSDTQNSIYEKCCIGSCKERTCDASDGKPCPLGKKCQGRTFEASDTQTCCPNEFQCIDWPVNCQAEGLFCLQQDTCNSLLGEFYPSNCPRPQVCCSKSPSQSCEVLGGEICPINKNCAEATVTVDGGENCCFAGCSELKSCSEIGGILEGSASWPSYKKCGGTEYTTLEGQCCIGSLVYNNCTYIGSNCTELQKCSQQTISTPDNPACCSQSVNNGVCIPKNCSEISNHQNCPINTKCNIPPIQTPDNLIPGCCVGGDCVFKQCSEIGANCSINRRCNSNLYQTSDSPACCLGGDCSILRQCNEFGNLCFPNERCNGLEMEASNGRCCVLGQCELNSCPGIGGRVCPQGTICNSTLLITNDTQGQARCCQNAECIVPPPDCLNNSYFCTPQEECDLVNGNPFDAVGCSTGKVCCTKSSSQNCSQLGGSVCSFNKLCNEQVISVADTNRCCLGSCNIFKNCNEMSGVVCPSDKKCSTTTTLAADTTECCVSGFCMRKSCEELGGQSYSLESLEKCSGTTINASDGTCCLNGVLEIKTCNEMNGLICSSNRECSESTIGASDGQCCLSRNCQLKDCSSIGGRQCPTGKLCKNSTVPSGDTETCCLDQCIDIPPTCAEAEGFCLTNQTCNSIAGEHFNTATCSGGKICCAKSPNNNCDVLGGMICGNNSKCINGPVTPVNDTSSCCFGSCTPKNCSEMSGRICPADKRCSSTPVSASDTSSCCTGNCLSSCTNQSYFCILQEQCRLVGGNIQSNLFCDSPFSCCSDNFNSAQNCTQLGGSVCSGNNELCQGTMVSTRDTEKCCFGECKSTLNITDCENNFFSCRTSCSASEEPAPYNCTQGNICCKPKPAQPATCVEALKTCTTIGECDRAGGETLSNFQCPGMFVCCSKPPAVERTCHEKGGVICPASRTCDGNVIPAFDTNECCMSGICDPLVVPYPCEEKNYNCRVSCFDSEEVTSDQCAPDKVCCKLKGEEPEGKSLWWLWLLMALIVLLIIALIFRNRLRTFLFAFSDKFKKSPSALPSRPPFFPPAIGRPMSRGMPPRTLSRPVTKSDIDSENVFKKLREMGGK